MKYIKSFESLIRQSSLDQMKKIAKMSKDTDIGHRTKEIEFYNIKNILDTDEIESYEKYTKDNK